jgi:hypothetical protein
MSRDLPTALETAIEEPVVRPFLAIYIDLPDVVRAWTGTGTITFADADAVSQDWTGAGGIGAIDTIGESTDGSATGIRASLFNIPSEFRDDIADQAVRGVAFEVYVGALNETYQQVEAATLIWKGRLDDYKITDNGDSINVEVMGESRGIDQRRPSIKRFTNEYQQRVHTGDKFFEYVPQMAEIQILWAAASQNSTASGGGGNANYVTGGGSQSFGGRNAL